jgi:hypothetical protein
MEIQWCPYRLKLEIQMTKFSRPLIFSGDATDLTLLEACREKLGNNGPPVDDVLPETGKCSFCFQFQFYLAAAITINFKFAISSLRSHSSWFLTYYNSLLTYSS